MVLYFLDKCKPKTDAEKSDIIVGENVDAMLVSMFAEEEILLAA